jgi:hypothetical protein
VSVRRASWALPLLVALATCSSQDNNTKVMVAVWSDLAVPNKIDEVRIDVKGPTAQPSLDFALGTGKTKLPLLVALVPPDNQNLQFMVTATAYLQSIPVVSQTARLSFAPGKSRILKLVLNGACQGILCPGMTCSAGTCQIIDVDVNGLTDYDPSAPLLPPDAGASPGLDGGAKAGVVDGGGIDAAGVDGSLDGQAIFDGAESKIADGPVPTGGTDASDGREANAGETNGAAGTGGTVAPTGGSGGTGGVGGGTAGAAGGGSAADAAPDAPAPGGATSSGGGGGGGSGGTSLTGGSAPTGGALNGGATSGGGAPSTGGAGTGGALATGGAATGGTSTGGAATGGSSTGGASTGGASTGGNSTGGSATGGVVATGGSAACAPPMAECDLNPATVCETNTQTDATHCGSCSNHCTYPVCTAGSCPTPTVYGRNTVPVDLTDPTIALNLGVNTLYGYRRAFSAGSVVALGAVTTTSGVALPPRTFRVGLYTDNSGIPGTLVATTNTLTAADGIVEGILSAPVPLSASSYWIMVLVGNAGTVKFTKFVLPSPNTEVIKGAAGIADWPATATYVDVTPNNFVPNFYAKAI